jgi:hypothetical protein
MKKQTIESRLKKLISMNDSVLNALLIERIIRIMEITEDDIRKNPNEWEKSLISINLVHLLNSNVSATLK